MKKITTKEHNYRIKDKIVSMDEIETWTKVKNGRN